jgi:hypothetical protein
MFSWLLMLLLASCSQVGRLPMQGATPEMIQALLGQEVVESIMPGSDWQTAGPYAKLSGLPLYSLPPHGLRFASIAFQEQSSAPYVGVEQTILQYATTKDASAALESAKGLSISYDSPAAAPAPFPSMQRKPELHADGVYFRCEQWGDQSDDRRWCAARMRYGIYFVQVAAVVSEADDRAFSQEQFLGLLLAVDQQMLQLTN